MAFNSSLIMESYHGGHCCGMSHIFSFPSTPDLILAPRPRMNPAEQAEALKANPYYILNSNDEYPEQKASERLRQVISNIEKGVSGVRLPRAQGIIEIVLNSSQIEYWEEFVISLGFKEVNSHRNSNSGNMLHVFHKNSGE